jgi:hypothetical protein
MRISVPSLIIGLALLAPTVGHAQLLTDYEGNGSFPAGITFQRGNFSGSSVGVTAATSALSEDYAQSATHSLKEELTFNTTSANPWARLTTSGLLNPTIDLNSVLTMSVLIVPASPLAAGDNSLGFTLGVRETNAPGPVGANGTGGGQIEFVGNSGKNGSAPIGQAIAADGAWHDLNFVMSVGMALPTAGLTGNGILESTTGFGTLEALNINPIANTGQAYTVYIDDIRQRPSNAVPEPGSFALLATGLLPVLGLRRRKR